MYSSTAVIFLHTTDDIVPYTLNLSTFTDISQEGSNGSTVQEYSSNHVLTHNIWCCTLCSKLHSLVPAAEVGEEKGVSQQYSINYRSRHNRFCAE